MTLEMISNGSNSPTNSALLTLMAEKETEAWEGAVALSEVT